MILKEKTVRALMCALTTMLTVICPNLTLASEAGGTSGGGTGKPAVAIASENLKAILHSDKVGAVLGLSFGIEEVKLISIDHTGYHYKLVANTRMKTIPCVIQATVWNKDAAPISQVKVINVRIVSGCSLEEIEQQKPKSVLEVYKSVFDLFPKTGFEGGRHYSDYLNVVRSLPKAKRDEIREFMRTSSEAKYFEIYSKNAEQMKGTAAQHPDMNFDNALYMLYVVMGFDPNSAGIIMPAVVGLKLAPFFIVD